MNSGKLIFLLLLAVLTAGSIGCEATSGTGAQVPKPKPYVLDFQADWCGPCRADKPYVDVLREMGVRVIEVDFDAHLRLVERYGVTEVPTYVLIQGNREIVRVDRARNLYPYFGRN